MAKKVVFSINESGHILGETFANVEHGNGEITFTSETKKTVKANLKTITSMIKAIEEGHYRIVKRDLNGQIEKEYHL